MDVSYIVYCTNQNTNTIVKCIPLKFLHFYHLWYVSLWTSLYVRYTPQMKERHQKRHNFENAQTHTLQYT